MKKRRTTYIVLGIAGLIGLGLFGAFLRDSFEWLAPVFHAKRVEILEAKIQGYKSGRKTWEIYSDYFWAGSNNNVFKSASVTDGKIYDNRGQLILTQLRAGGVKVNTRTKVMTVTGNMSVSYVYRDPVFLKANEFRYYEFNETATLSGEVEIEGGSFIIETESAKLKIDDEELTIQKPFLIMSEDKTIQADSFKVFFAEEYADLEGAVEVLRPAVETLSDRLDEREFGLKQKESRISADRMRIQFEKSGEDRIEFLGQVHLFQEDKYLKGDKGVFDRDKQVFTLSGNVHFFAESLAWILTQQTQDNFKNEKIKTSIMEPVHFYAERLTMIKPSQIVILEGGVRGIQDEKVLKCNKLTYNDHSKMIRLEGDVYVKRDKDDIIESEILYVDIKNESFWSESEVEVEFNLSTNP